MAIFINLLGIFGGCCRTPYKKIKQKPQLSQAEAFLCPQNFVILWYSN